MPYGYAGRILHVDLGRGTLEIENPPESFYRRYLGGSAMGLHYLLERIRPGTDPLGPENVLTLMVGITTGAPISGQSRMCANALSPLTDGIGDSQCGGFFPAEMKFAGFDGIVASGRSPEPVYLWLHDGQAELRPAGHLWGKLTADVDDAIRAELGDAKIQVAQCGPAGERLVRLAAIINMANRANGRTGMGAVMGSKNLKAVAVRGKSKRLPVADAKRLNKLARWGAENMDVNDDMAGLREHGTGGVLSFQHSTGTLPTLNYTAGQFEYFEDICGETMTDTILKERDTCYACAVHCKRVVETEWQGHAVERRYGGPEYETLATLGSYCGVRDLAAIAYANQLCNAYGLDTIGTGATIAWAMECFERGLLTSQDTNGLDLSFGSADGLVETTRRIGQLSGIGAVLAEGVLRAANGLGQGSGEWAMQVKGLEMAGCDPRTQPGLALRLAAGLRPPTLDGRDDPSATAADACREEDLAAAGDSLAICPNARRYFRDFPAEAARMYTLATGMPLNPAELRRAGERTNNLIKAIDIREGWQRPDDWLPPRLFREPLDTGEGAVVSEKDLTAAIDGYYRGRGWSAEGLVPGEKLAALGMDDLREMLKGNRHGAPPHTLR